MKTKTQIMHNVKAATKAARAGRSVELCLCGKARTCKAK